MSDINSTAAGSLDGGLDSLNTTLNANNATAAPLTIMDHLQDVDFIILELKLISGAMGIIFLGAHASLRRPPSAAASKTKKGRKRHDDEAFTQGLELSDAIVFPVMAAFVLVGLYYLIQWLKDPAILNKILRWYMSAMSIASLVTLYAHGVEVATSFVFPRYWRGRDGGLRTADQGTRTVVRCDDAGNRTGDHVGVAGASPLPGVLGIFAPVRYLQKRAWSLRDLLTRHWVLKLSAHGMGEESITVVFAHVMAIFMSVATTIAYFATSWPILSNMLGYGMCYGSFLILSPTDFLTGSLVLWGLFFYDILMVFYTPYMVTVATTLDVPIKLTYEAAARKSILGLGDIVIPGMVIAWALRLDLWIHYVRRIKYEVTDLKIVEKDASGAIVTRSETKHREVKAPYLSAKGNWGEKLWTRGALYFSSPQSLPPDVAASNFPKVYFYASMVGYLVGMLVTLAMLLVFEHGQPALLYLVPGVLGSLTLTSLARGEFKQMWKYTEDGSLDKIDVVVDLDEDGKVVKSIGKLEDGVVDTTKDKDKDKDKKDEESNKGKEDSKEKSGNDGPSRRKAHRVFSISLDAPAEGEEE